MGQESQRLTLARRGVLLAVFIGLVPCLLVSLAAGFGLQVYYMRHQPQYSRTIFDRPVTPSTGVPVGTGNVARLHPVWAYRFVPDLPTGIAVAGNIIFVRLANASSSDVAAVQGGKQLWRQTVAQSSDFIDGTCADGADVFVATDSSLGATGSRIHAFDARSGQSRWLFAAEAPLDGVIATARVVCANDMVYFSTRDQVQALDEATGKLLWRHRFTGDPKSAYGPFAPALVAGGGSVYLFLTTSPYVAGPAVTALDARTGTVRWQLQEVDASTLAAPVAPLLANEVIYRPLRSYIEALDVATGTRVWIASVSVLGRSNITGLSLDTRHLYVSGSGYTQALDLDTGQRVWQQSQLQGSQVRAGPVANGGIVYVATATPFTGYGHRLFTPVRAPHWLYALDAANGRVVSMLQVNDASFEPTLIAADGDRLYVLGNRMFVGSDESASSKPDLYALGV